MTERPYYRVDCTACGNRGRIYRSILAAMSAAEAHQESMTHHLKTQVFIEDVGPPADREE